MKLLITLLVILSSICSFAQEKKTLDKQFEMKQYYLVFLKAGDNRTQDSATTSQIMKGHLAHLTEMYENDKMSLCGPMMSENEIKGVCVYHINDSTEVRRLAESDPAVRAGRLRVEILPWYSAKGMTLK